MPIVRNLLIIDGVVLILYGSFLAAYPDLVLKEYTSSGSDAGDVEKLIMRLVGGMLVSGGTGSIVAGKVFGDTEQKCFVVMVALMCLTWTLVHGVEGVYVDADSFNKTTTIANAAIGVFFLLLNSLAMTAAVWCEIPSREEPDTDTQDPSVQNRIFTINESNPEDDMPEPSTVPFIREVKQEKPKSSRSRLLALAKPEYRIILAGCIALCIRLPFSLSIPHFVSECIGALINKDQDEAIRNVVMLLIAGTVDAMLDFWNFFLFGYAQQRLIRRLRTRVFSAFLSQEIGFFDSSPTGDMLSRLQSDTSEMGNDLTWVFRWTIEATVRIMGIIGYMFVREYRLAWVTVAVIPVCAVINKFYGSWLEKNAVKVQKSLAEANSVAQEVLAAVRTVFSFNTQRFETDRYEHQINNWYNLNVKQVAMQAVYYMVISTFLVNTVVQASILFYGIHLVIHKGMQPSVLLAFMLYQGDLQNWVTSLLNSFTNLIKSSGAGEKVFELLDRKNRLQQHEGIRPDYLQRHFSEDEQIPAIEFHSVHFKYETRENPVLRGINLTVPFGKVVALVGQSGAGKSTIFHLLEHFYDPSMGQVLVNGESVARIDPQWLHSSISIVGQEPVLFSGTVLRNILYAMLDQQPTLIEDIEDDSILCATVMAKVHRAAEIANAKLFIEDLPNGYNTEVGEKGVQLSGGQKQRIAIARALIQDPKIILLDEATSALDASSELHVQQALEAATKDRTTIVIAHRLSTVARADCICVMDEGVIVEKGTHDELMNRPDNPNGMSYKKLVLRQMQT
eukprot:TRINITY_DN3337_c3_g1_i1.p1 TRINITY_DN3337_c3_g1~~TRINITY_DN3337_c3_g1_i1.p1  ORF type:complete len:789 (+),score=129.28 TRINITY_DN3337_c3_g1_i1:25-2391(+)